MTLTLNGYYYYDINLLTRININNTTTKNIYYNDNGFPVAVQRITIDAGAMTVSLDTSNQKSALEIDEIDDQYPSEYDYYKTGYSIKQFSKYDYSAESYVL